MSRRTNILLTCAALVAVSVGLAEPALASSGGGGLPWESPLQQIQQSITGPVAGFIALAAVAIAGAMLIFGGELNDFARRLCYVAIVGGVLLGAPRSLPFQRDRRVDRRGSRKAEQGTPEPKATPATAGRGSWRRSDVGSTVGIAFRLVAVRAHRPLPNTIRYAPDLLRQIFYRTCYRATSSLRHKSKRRWPFKSFGRSYPRYECRSFDLRRLLCDYLGKRLTGTPAIGTINVMFFSHCEAVMLKKVLCRTNALRIRRRQE